MPEETRRKLEELRKQLDGIDEPDRDELKEAVSRYEPESAGDDERQDLVERLREAALRYEASHPELSRFIAGVIDHLTAVGI